MLMSGMHIASLLSPVFKWLSVIGLRLRAVCNNLLKLGTPKSDELLHQSLLTDD